MTNKYTLLFALCFALGSASAQCPDATFDGQTFYQTVYIPDRGCYTEPLVNPAYVVDVDTCGDGYGRTYPGAILAPDACPDGYGVVDYSERIYFTNNFTYLDFLDSSYVVNAVVTAFGDTIMPAATGTNLFFTPNWLKYYSNSNEWKCLEHRYLFLAYSTGAGSLVIRESTQQLNAGSIFPFSDETTLGVYLCKAGNIPDIELDEITVYNYECVAPDLCPYDVNDDGEVGVTDILDVLAWFGYICE